MNNLIVTPAEMIREETRKALLTYLKREAGYQLGAGARIQIRLSKWFTEGKYAGTARLFWVWEPDDDALEQWEPQEWTPPVVDFAAGNFLVARCLSEVLPVQYTLPAWA